VPSIAFAAGSVVPTGLDVRRASRIPALKGWAIFSRSLRDEKKMALNTYHAPREDASLGA
jgi:hypothetical protein